MRKINASFCLGAIFLILVRSFIAIFTFVTDVFKTVKPALTPARRPN